MAPDTIGYVPERLAGRSKLTGAEYVDHMGRIKGLDSEAIHARSSELFERLNLQPGPTLNTDQLSKGNRQKVVLAQAFLAPVGLLVLDEPFSGLDAIAHGALHELLDEAQTAGSAVLISSHRADPALGADVVLHIGDGRLNVLLNPRTETPNLDDTDHEIELVAVAGASDPERVATLLGVRSIQHDALGMTLSLVADSDHTDTILSTVISMGWSVISVSAPGHERK
jgi:ABC-type multidrug transport system ATPase subunit